MGVISMTPDQPLGKRISVEDLRAAGLGLPIGVGAATLEVYPIERPGPYLFTMDIVKGPEDSSTGPEVGVMASSWAGWLGGTPWTTAVVVWP